MHLVKVIAAAYRGGEVEYDELLGSGREGLTVAARSFDPDKGTEFSTWATTKIESYITHRIRDEMVADGTVGADSIERVYEYDVWGENGNAMAISEAWVALMSSPDDVADRYSEIKDKEAMFDAAFISLTGNQRKLIKWIFLDTPKKSIADAARELGTSYFRTFRMLKSALITMREVITRMETNSGGSIANGHPLSTGLHGSVPGTVAA